MHGDRQLSAAHREAIQSSEENGIGICAISCWEVAKLAELGRLKLPCSLADWFEQALSYPGMNLLPLTPEVAIGSTTLPGDFHRDPADQLIVATARAYSLPLLTADQKILGYPYVNAR